MAVAPRIDTIVTFLEMKRPPAGPSPAPPSGDVSIAREENPSVAFYRYLYDAVGAPWLWYERRLLDDDVLAALLGDERVALFVLRVGGAVAGYSELDGRTPPDLDIAYFGLTPEFFGRGLGPYLLRWTIDRAWEQKPARLLVNTCSLDHPKALALYEGEGFQPYAIASRSFDDPRATGLIPG